MKNEIDKLRLVRSKSQKCMGKSQSSIILKRAVIYEEKEDKALKDKFIQKQK